MIKRAVALSAIALSGIGCSTGTLGDAPSSGSSTDSGAKSDASSQTNADGGHPEGGGYEDATTMSSIDATTSSNDAASIIDSAIDSNTVAMLDANKAIDADDGSTGDTTGVVAVSASMFLSSLGVNTHIDQGYDPTQYTTPLQYTGIRNIRDSFRNVSSTVTLHQQTGVLVDLQGGGDLTDQIAAAKTLASSGALLSIEGANEPNNFPITYNNAQGGGLGTWVPVAQFQKDLYSAVKADATLRAYPVFSVSEDGAETDNVGLQFLTIPIGSNITMPDGTKYADYANVHNYVIGNAGTYVDNQAWQAADPTLNGAWDSLYIEYGLTWGKHYAGYSNSDLMTLARVTTETGWDTSADPGGQHVQGVVLVNTYLAQFKRGWRYTFIYEMIDAQGSTGDQGVFDTTASPKLAATYIHNMTSILADTGSIATLGRLNYSIASEPATVHDLLLEKSNGAFELVVWDERASATDAITVSLGTLRKTVNVYDVTMGTTTTQTLSNVSSVMLTLSDHPAIIEIE